MSAEKWTTVDAGDSPGFAVRGHVPRADALTAAEKFYAAQLAAVRNALEAIRSGHARVFQQRGLYRVTDLRELPAHEGSRDHGTA